MEMIEVTLLNVEKCVESCGETRLRMPKKYSTTITDFAILLGGKILPIRNTTEGENIENRTCWWWTKSDNFLESAYAISSRGNISPSNIRVRSGGIRPSLPYSLISSIFSNVMQDRSEIFEIGYGEYPQTVALEEYSKILEIAYNDGTIKMTGKSYTTDSINLEEYDKNFKPRTYIEYEYNGKKYIRFVADSNCKGQTLSDGRKIELGKTYWIKVEAIKWLIDKSEKIVLSKKIILSGIQFDTVEKYNGDFENTCMYKFLNTYFINDIIPSIQNEQKNEKNSLDQNDNKEGLGDYFLQEIVKTKSKINNNMDPDLKEKFIQELTMLAENYLNTIKGMIKAGNGNQKIIVISEFMNMLVNIELRILECNKEVNFYKNVENDFDTFRKIMKK